jgi:purine-nucleoside phosphorylase
VGNPLVAIVLGSGLGQLAEGLHEPVSIPIETLPTGVRGRVPGHAGRIVAGRLAGVHVLVQQGRIHLYEGHPSARVALAVRAFCALGCRAVVLTNAAGALRENLTPGTLMRIRDHINLQCGGTLRRPHRCEALYSPEWGSVLDQAAREEGIELQTGVYAGVLGPSYETPSEVRMLASLGADAVGMSTVVEAAAAAESGAQVAGVSLIANLASGLGQSAPDHAEVLAAGRAGSADLARLLQRALALALRRDLLR